LICIEPIAINLEERLSSASSASSDYRARRARRARRAIVEQSSDCRATVERLSNASSALSVSILARWSADDDFGLNVIALVDISGKILGLAVWIELCDGEEGRGGEGRPPDRVFGEIDGGEVLSASSVLSASRGSSIGNACTICTHVCFWRMCTCMYFNQCKIVVAKVVC